MSAAGAADAAPEIPVGSLGIGWYVYPTYSSTLSTWIEDAFQARTARFGVIKNTRERKKANSSCV